MEPHILLMSASVGAGHDRAAEQIAQRLHADGLRTIRADFVELVRGGHLLRRAYRAQLDFLPGTWDWLLGLAGGSTGHALTARLTAAAAKRTTGLITPATQAVISTYPLASQLLGRLRTSGQLSVPVVTYLTDMSVHPLWVAPGVDAHVAIHAIPAAQALSAGAYPVRVTPPLVSPAFTPRGGPAEQLRARRRLGLPPTGRLALVVTGSWGVGEFERTASDIAATGAAIPVVACGANASARTRLNKAGTAIALGWIDDMPSLIQACDVVVQSGGGMTSLEALATGTPVITYRCLPGHGRTSAAALDMAGWAPWVKDQAELADALQGSPALAPIRDDGGFAALIRELVGLPARRTTPAVATPHIPALRVAAPQAFPARAVSASELRG